jgi:hypothetical protein
MALFYGKLLKPLQDRLFIGGLRTKSKGNLSSFGTIGGVLKVDFGGKHYTKYDI